MFSALALVSFRRLYGRRRNAIHGLVVAGGAECRHEVYSVIVWRLTPTLEGACTEGFATKSVF